MTNYSGVSRILSSYLGQENGSETAKTPDNFGADIFIDDFEDEFPMGDSADTEGWTPESRRANEGRPWGGKFGDRPKVHEVNQPVKAQERGWRLLDLHPNRNHKEEYYRLAGTPAELRILLQLVRATREMVGKNINFEEWFEQWEKGFPDAKEQRNGNFLLTGDKQWDRIKKPESRPRFKEWTTSQQRIDWGFRVIEYWRDRSSESDSVVLSGTDLQLVNHVIQIEYEGGGSQQSASSDTIRYSGIPEITLYFKGVDKALPKNRQRVKGEKSFRFIGYTDNPIIAQKRRDLELITQTDISRIGTKIRSVFKTKPPYVWAKGKDQVIYHDWQQGYNLNVYALNHTEGERLILAILSIQNHTIDETFLKYSEAKNVTKAYPPTTEIQVMGQTQEIPERLPKSKVSFDRATLYLPTLKQTLVIA